MAQKNGILVIKLNISDAFSSHYPKSGMTEAWCVMPGCAYKHTEITMKYPAV